MSRSKTDPVPARRRAHARLGPTAWWRRGAAASEFVLVVPLFLLILFATADIVRLFRVQLRMEMIAVQIGQIMSQCGGLTVQDFDDPNFGLWAHARRIAGDIVDINSATGGAMIISALGPGNNNTANRLAWQRRTGNVTPVSAFGTVAAPNPVLRGRNGTAFLVPPGQALFGTEVFALVRPWTLSAGLIGTVLPAELRGTSLFLSRAREPALLLEAAANPSPPAELRDCTL